MRRRWDSSVFAPIDASTVNPTPMASGSQTIKKIFVASRWGTKLLPSVVTAVTAK